MWLKRAIFHAFLYLTISEYKCIIVLVKLFNQPSFMKIKLALLLVILCFGTVIGVFALNHTPKPASEVAQILGE